MARPHPSNLFFVASLMAVCSRTSTSDANAAEILIAQPAPAAATPAAIEAPAIEVFEAPVVEIDIAVPAAAEPAPVLNFVLRGDLAVMGDEAALDDEQLRPFLDQLKPVLIGELSFAARVCQFDDAARNRATAEAKAWLNEYVPKYARQQRAAQGVVQFRPGQPVAEQQGPNQAIEEAVASIVKRIATSQQTAAYEEERKLRQDFERQAVIAAMVARIDEKLLLSAAQRLQMLELFGSQEAALPSVQALLQFGDYIPELPGDLAAKTFHRDQAMVWNSLQRISFAQVVVGWQDFAWIDGGAVIGDVQLDDPGPQPAASGGGLLRAVDEAAGAVRDALGF